MSEIKENLLPQEVFSKLQEHCLNSKFDVIGLGDSKEIHYIQTPNEILQYFEIPDHEIILTFIRKANKDIDTLPNIHADNIVEGQKVDLAGVFYINSPTSCSPNGTAFWSHDTYGKSLPKKVTDKEYDRILRNHSNDMSKWEKVEFIANVENRLLIYPANKFHSKFPFVIKEGNRIVLVVFYAKK